MNTGQFIGSVRFAREYKIRTRIIILGEEKTWKGSPMNNIDELKLALVQARAANEKAKEIVAVKWKDVEATLSFQSYNSANDAFKEAAEAMLVADKALRDAAMDAWVRDGAGEVSPGVRIKMRHKVRYVLETVTAWAKEEAKHLFKFDTKSFEDAAKKGTLHGAPFEKYDEPYCELSSKSEDFQLKEEL